MGVSTVGDLWVGTKINLISEADKKAAAFALRGMVKVPTGSKDDGTTSGEMDYAVDAIVSKEAGQVADLTAYGGYIVRGNPTGYDLTNGIRWGVGAGFPTRKNFGFTFTTELFGEFYGNKTITAPAGREGRGRLARSDLDRVEEPARRRRRRHLGSQERSLPRRERQLEPHDEGSR